MLHVFFGSDRQKVRDAVADFSEKNLPPDGTLTILEAASYTEGQLADALGAASLFGGAEWFLLDTPSEHADFAEAVQTNVAELAESSNTFLLLEAPLLAAAKKKYQKYATTFTEFTAVKAERFNSFSLAEAVAQKDKRKLWLLLQEAKLAGLREEEIIGILWWQLKALRLAACTNSAQEAGMKEFPYNKAKRALTKFQSNEIERLSQTLLELYHDGHAGVRELDIALESWMLQLS